MTEPPDLTHIRVDDIPLLVGVLRQMNLAELYDQAIGDHGAHQGLSGGWMLTLWLTFILSAGDHTKANVAEWVARHAELLRRLTGQPVTAEDFNDTRLGRLLTRLSDRERWERFEAAVWAHSVAVYALDLPCVGGLTSAVVDSTTAAGYHTVHDAGLMQRGHSKDHRPDLPQLKLMTVSVHPSGQLVGTDVVSGQVADDGLYAPLIARVRALFGQVGLLYVGDSKMAALATRAQIAQAGDYYLTVAPHTGQVAQDLPNWIETALMEPSATQTLCNEADDTLGIGYEFSRICQISLPLGPRGGHRRIEWSERVQVFRSQAVQAQQAQALTQRLARAEAALWALNQPRGRGHRRLKSRADFEAAVQAITDTQRVSGLLVVTPQVDEQRQTRLVGRGRRGPQRPTREVITQRFTVAAVQRDEVALAWHTERLGWRVQLTNAPPALSLNACVVHYRANWVGERNYHQLKDRPLGLSPLFVRNDDQLIGLTQLLTLGVRTLSVIELQTQRGLQADDTQLAGLYAGNPKQATDRPTAVAILTAIARMEITLTVITWHGHTAAHLTPLPPLLVQVLRYLQLPITLYTDLAAQNSLNTT